MVTYGYSDSRRLLMKVYGYIRTHMMSMVTWVL